MFIVIHNSDTIVLGDKTGILQRLMVVIKLGKPVKAQCRENSGNNNTANLSVAWQRLCTVSNATALAGNVCQVLCVEVVGVTTSEGFPVSIQATIPHKS